MNANKMRSAAKEVSQMGMLLAIAAILSLVESALPQILPVPGVRLGLGNLCVLYCVFMLGTKRAFTLALLKSIFVLLARGSFIAAGLSFAGGVLSVAVMLALAKLCGGSSRILLISAAGGVAHNIGQLVLAGVILRMGLLVLYSIPLLVASGIVMGMLTGAVYTITLKYLNRRL